MVMWIPKPWDKPQRLQCVTQNFSHQLISKITTTAASTTWFWWCSHKKQKDAWSCVQVKHRSMILGKSIMLIEALIPVNAAFVNYYSAPKSLDIQHRTWGSGKSKVSYLLQSCDSQFFIFSHKHVPTKCVELQLIYFFSVTCPWHMSSYENTTIQWSFLVTLLPWVSCSSIGGHQN